MLNSQTKRRIDSARDILVGQLPLPTDQVELITIALIYKFMDDIDQISCSMDRGKATFFVGEVKLNGRTVKLADLNWRSLVSNTLDAETRVAKFAQGIEAVSNAKHIPELFKSIFKNALLKFRDGRILKLFLDEINNFTYDHSEELGNAFEYLLSAMGSQGENGQFRTPRHIIDFIVDVVDPQKEDTILDPACGTGGFLISAYKHILEANTSPAIVGDEVTSLTSKSGKDQSLLTSVPTRKWGDLLTGAERKKLMENIAGYDITPLMTRLSRVNMYLHHFPSPIIHEYDTLTNDTRWDEKFDCILANPPFMTPKGGVSPHNKFRIPATRAEVLFSDYIAEHLTPDGKAGFIVPEGIIFQSQNAYKNLRRMLVQDYLWAVVSLPAGVFNPYAGVKTSILLLNRTLARREKEILFVKVENDGFDLGAQRRPIEENDLPEALKVLMSWKEKRNLAEGAMAHLVTRKRILESAEINLSGERYRTIRPRTANWPMASIGSLCNLQNGLAFKPTDWEKADSGGLPIIRIQNLNNVDAEFNYFSGHVDERRIVKHGDLLFSWSGSRGTSFGPHIWNGSHGILNQHIFKVEHNGNVHRRFFYWMLKRAVAEVEENLHGGVGLVHITKGNLERIEIPLPPLEEQERLVAELEGYRQIIESARQILTHYKPTLCINPEWTVAKLADVIDGKPKNGYSGSPVPYTAKTKVLTLTATTSGRLDITKFKYVDEDIPNNAPCRCRRGDIYLQRGNTKELVGTAALFDVDAKDFIYPDLMIRVRADEKKITPEFLLHVLQSEPVRDFVKRSAGGSAGSMPKINQGIVESILIPVPPLAEQRRIVSELEAERALVEANRALAARFEQKLQTRLAEIWGEKPPAPSAPEKIVPTQIPVGA